MADRRTLVGQGSDLTRRLRKGETGCGLVCEGTLADEAIMARERSNATRDKRKREGDCCGGWLGNKKGREVGWR